MLLPRLSSSAAAMNSEYKCGYQPPSFSAPRGEETKKLRCHTERTHTCPCSQHTTKTYRCCVWQGNKGPFSIFLPLSHTVAPGSTLPARSSSAQLATSPPPRGCCSEVSAGTRPSTTSTRWPPSRTGRTPSEASTGRRSSGTRRRPTGS